MAQGFVSGLGEQHMKLEWEMRISTEGSSGADKWARMHAECWYMSWSLSDGEKMESEGLYDMVHRV